MFYVSIGLLARVYLGYTPAHKQATLLHYLFVIGLNRLECLDVRLERYCKPLFRFRRRFRLSAKEFVFG